MKRGERMKKHILIDLTLVLLILGVIFWNVRVQQEAVTLRKKVSTLNEAEKKLMVKAEELLDENERLSEQANASDKSLKKFQQNYGNAGTNTNLNTEFISVVTKLFGANLNFTPETFKNRKREVSGFLSEELSKEYFGESRKTYQDSNGTTSILESLEVYLKGVQNRELEAIVIVYHKSRQNGQDWNKGMNIFKVTFNSETKMVTEIENIGSGFSGKGK